MPDQATNDDITKAAAISMMRLGLATYQEIAELSGRSKQIVRHWGKDFAIQARKDRVAHEWAKALKRANPNY
jgi:predicted transcriptional regulator